MKQQRNQLQLWNLRFRVGKKAKMTINTCKHENSDNAKCLELTDFHVLLLLQLYAI